MEQDDSHHQDQYSGRNGQSALAGGMAGFAPDPDGVRYLFIDFNAYFASVEQHDDPALRGRPVMVIPLPSEHSGAIAVSYEAKALGIRRGTTVREARMLCPAIAIRPARHDRYVAVHHLLMREIARHIPIQQICSVDECVCRLGADEQHVAAAWAKALAIKRGLYRHVGPALRCSIGLAPSSLLAKLAAEMEKPDGLVALTARDLPGRLHDMPLRDIPGIGGGMARRLERAGVADFAALWALAPKQARAIWNSVAGERFLYGLKGYDIPPLETAEKRMIGHSRVLSGTHRQPDGARIVARALLLKAASRLRHYGLWAGALHLGVRLHGGGGAGEEVMLRRTQNSWRLLTALEEAWRAVIPRLMRRAWRDGHRTILLKHVSVHLSALSPRPPEPDLFVPGELDWRDGCESALWDRIDRLNRRYGMETVGLGSQVGLDLNYLGVKIAFSRVPEAAEFAAANRWE